MTDIDLEYSPTITPISQPTEHKPGDPHQYRITCVVCGERGTIRLTVDPETSAS